MSGAISRFWRNRTVHGKGKIAVVCAGTSDIPVAEEAQVTAELMGNEVDTIHDIGVAGIHRLISNSERLSSARVVYRLRGDGGRAPERRRRHGVGSRDRRADERGIWSEFQRPCRVAGHAE